VGLPVFQRRTGEYYGKFNTGIRIDICQKILIERGIKSTVIMEIAVPQQ